MVFVEIYVIIYAVKFVGGPIILPPAVTRESISVMTVLHPIILDVHALQMKSFSHSRPLRVMSFLSHSFLQHIPRYTPH
jgi:hypothetical protein